MGVRADVEKCQQRSKQSSGHRKAVMMQIHLYKNHWVVKLKWGCRGEEAVWKMNCFLCTVTRPSYVTRQTLMHLIAHWSFVFPSSCCAIRTTACPRGHETDVRLVNTAALTLSANSPFPCRLFQRAPPSHTSQTCRSHDRGTVLLF